MSLEPFIEMPLKPRRITDWLEKNYPKRSTRYNFENVLKNWIKCFYGKDSVTNYIGYNLGQLSKEEVKRIKEERMDEIEEGIERYLIELDNRDFTDDFKTFLNWARNEGYAPLYIRSMSGKGRYFFSRNDPRCKISDDDWSDIKRTLIPKSTRAATQDDILTKDQLKIVLKHLSIQGKAIALFLLSTGARIGATCQLQMSDINLDSDPPEVNIREEYTKGEVGGRVMWFSEEAKDAIIEWHKERIFKGKPGSLENYDKNLVFSSNERNYRRIWNRALERADGGCVPPVLAKRDPSTKMRLHVYHSHTLRKFFRTNMGVEGSYQGRSGVPDMIVHAWMGHKAYLNEYDRLGRRGMAEIYKENMHIVTVHEVGTGEKARVDKLTHELGLSQYEIAELRNERDKYRADYELRTRLQNIIDKAKLDGWPEEIIKKLEENLESVDTFDDGVFEFHKLERESELEEMQS